MSDIENFDVPIQDAVEDDVRIAQNGSGANAGKFGCGCRKGKSFEARHDGFDRVEDCDGRSRVAFREIRGNLVEVRQSVPGVSDGHFR
jgi:hypothetical protein